MIFAERISDVKTFGGNWMVIPHTQVIGLGKLKAEFKDAARHIPRNMYKTLIERAFQAMVDRVIRFINDNRSTFSGG